MAPNKKPRVPAKLAILFAACAIALLVAEGVVRVAGIAPQINRINPAMARTVYRISENAALGYVFKENYRDEGNPDLKSSYPRINAHGFRDIEREYAKPPGVRRILLLGDSVVAGAVNIREIDDTISRQLEKLLEGENIEVLNMGVNGYCTYAELEMLRQRGLEYAPDLVVVVFTSNDFLNINSDLGMVTQPLAVRRLFVHSHLFRFVAVKWNLFGLRTEHGVQEIAGEWAGRLSSAEGAARARAIMNSDEPDSETIRQHLEAVGPSNVHKAIPELKRLADERGFAVVIGIWPKFVDRGFVDLETWGVEQITPVFEETMEIERLAEQCGIPYFRFSRLLGEDLEGRVERGEVVDPNPKELYTSGDDMHPNPAGAAAAARGLAKILRENPALLAPRRE